MQALLDRVLRRFITRGTLTVAWPDRTIGVYGREPAPAAGLSLHTRAAARRLLLDPTLALGELYMSGGLTLRDCTLDQLMDLFGANIAANAAGHPGISLRVAWRGLRRRIDQYNPIERARRNVAHHYDLSNRLYAMFLDRDMQYSCAYFPRGDETLDDAQAAKKRHIAAKLCLDCPDLRVLDIGSGWGGLAITLARDYGARVTGVTLSREQLTESRARAAAAGLSDRVRFELLDYRALTGVYDRIVSVGMFEHVGLAHYGEFFGVIARVLAPDGIALLHTIGRSQGPLSTNKFLAKYIFPGGYSPALSEVAPVIERSGLIVTDVEILRLHYAKTLHHWRTRFAARRDEIGSLYDERFCRMFEYYLTIAEIGFTRLGNVNFQIQLTRDQTAAPLTRDYIAASEHG